MPSSFYNTMNHLFGHHSLSMANKFLFPTYSQFVMAALSIVLGRILRICVGSIGKNEKISYRYFPVWRDGNSHVLNTPADFTSLGKF